MWVRGSNWCLDFPTADVTVSKPHAVQEPLWPTSREFHGASACSSRCRVPANGDSLAARPTVYMSQTLTRTRLRFKHVNEFAKKDMVPSPEDHCGSSGVSLAMPEFTHFVPVLPTAAASSVPAQVRVLFWGVGNGFAHARNMVPSSNERKHQAHGIGVAAGTLPTAVVRMS